MLRTHPVWQRHPAGGVGFVGWEKLKMGKMGIKADVIQSLLLDFLAGKQAREGN